MTTQKFSTDGNTYKCDLAFFKLAYLHALHTNIDGFTCNGRYIPIKKAANIIEKATNAINVNGKRKIMELA